MTQRTAIVTIYDDAGPGGTVLTSGTVAFPEKVGYEARIWTVLDGAPLPYRVGVHTFRLPFREEAYGIRISLGIVNGPIRTGGMRFDHIDIEMAGAPTVTLPTDDDNPYATAAVGGVIVIGGGGIRHQLGPRNATRCRFVVGAVSADTVFAGAKPVRKSVRLSTGIDAPYPRSIAVSGATLTSALAYKFGGATNAGRQGLCNPYGELDSGNGVGGGSLLEYLPGWEQNYHVARKRADGVMDRHGVDSLDFATGDPADPSQVTHYIGTDRTKGYGLGGSERRGWLSAAGTAATPTAVGGQLPEFWAGDPEVDGDVTAFWHNSTAGTYETYMVYQAMPHDLPHLGRTSSNIEPMAEEWGDPIARFDQSVVAQDAEYLIARYLPFFEREGREARGAGSSSLGARSWGWATDVLNSSPLRRHRILAAKMAEAMSQIQMTNGMFQHQASSGNPNPNPWGMGSSAAPPGSNFPSSWDVQQTMEATICAWALARTGKILAAAKFLDSEFVGGAGAGEDVADVSLKTRAGFIPKYVATRKSGLVEHRIVSWVGVPDFWSWVAIGMGIRLSRFSDQYVTAANTNPLPLGGTGGSTAGTVAQLKVQNATSHSFEQTALAISGLEIPPF